MSDHTPRPRLVIADNDPEVLDLLATDLVAEGYEIAGQATQGDEALAICERVRPDALIVDYRMPPGPNGLETAARAKELGVPVVLYTNYRDPVIERGAGKIGIVMLPKGNIRALRRAIAELLTP